MKKILILLILIGILISGCNNYYQIKNKYDNKTDYELNESSKYENIMFAYDRGPCFGSCPVYSFIIYGNGNAYFFGDSYINMTGYYIGKVKKQVIDKLVSIFTEKNFFEFNESYYSMATDLASVTTTVQIGDKIKSVYDYGNTGPSTLQELEDQLDNTGKNILWQKINVSKEICDNMNVIHELRLCYRKIPNFGCNQLKLNLTRNCYYRKNENEIIIETEYGENSKVKIQKILNTPFLNIMNISRYIDSDYSEDNNLNPINTTIQVLYSNSNVECNIQIPMCIDRPQFSLNFSKIKIEVFYSYHRYISVRNIGPYDLKKGSFSLWKTEINETTNESYTKLLENDCWGGGGEGKIYEVCYIDYGPSPEEKSNYIFKYRNETINHKEVGYFLHTTPYNKT